MTRGDLVTAIGEIVNAKLVDMEDDVLNATKFYERIEAELARDCSLTTADTRELLRHMAHVPKSKQALRVPGTTVG